MVASKMRQRKSTSERTASSAENSTSSVYWRASFTARTAASSTASGSMRSLCFMWMGLVAMKVWMRPELAPLIASPARFTSLSLARAREHTVESLHRERHGADRVEVAGAGGGEARLDDVHPQPLELLADAHLLVPGHGRAGALLAVAHGGVENDQLVLHGISPCESDGLTRPALPRRPDAARIGGWGF